MPDPVLNTNPTIPQNVPNANTGASSKSIFDSQNYVPQKYNENYYNVDLYLDNSGNFDNPRRYFINPSAVLGLHISDTVNDWVVDGTLTFMYLPGGVEDLDKIKTGSASPTPISGKTEAAAAVGESLKSYLFRGDGFDLLRVMLSPISRESDGAEAQMPGVDISLNNTKWTLSYLFSIYEIEDVRDVPELEGPLGSYTKCLKLKFHDVRYQMLQTTNIEYSSAEPKDDIYEANFQSEMAPGQGVMYTGHMLRDVMNYALANVSMGGCREFEIEETNDPTLWDKGKAELFYTSAAASSVEDDVDYIFSHHVSEKELEGGVNSIGAGAVFNDMALLHTDRSDKPGFLENIRLTPLSTFFEKAGSTFDKPGELQKEHFFVTSFTEEVTLTNLHLAPIGGDGNSVDLKTSKYGQILSYSFVDMSPSVNSNMFCSTPVYSVDIGDRVFNVEFKGNDIMSARRMISNSYISKLFKQGEDNEQLFLPTIHKNKRDLNIFPTFSLNGNNPAVRQRNGLHHLLYTGVFQNACICFKVLGLTLRESGTFIGIDKADGCPENDYNHKLYGQWFVVKVDHVFEAGAYVNFIYAVKIHRHKPLQTSFEGTLTN